MTAAPRANARENTKRFFTYFCLYLTERARTAGRVSRERIARCKICVLTIILENRANEPKNFQKFFEKFSFFPYFINLC